MKNGKGIVALSVMSLLVGASGLGIGVYSYINLSTVQGPPGDPGDDGTDGIDGVNGTLDNLVAIWDTVTGSGTDFNLTLLGIVYNHSEYFDLTETYTKIQVLNAGWYRFSLKCILNGVTAGNYYSFSLFRNDARIERFWYSQTPTGVTYHMVNAIVYAHSDGDDFFTIRGDSGAFFSILGQAEYNQLVLEYISET
jgi:hypothetical protein